MKHHRIALALFLLLVVGGGLVIGFLNTPGDWYAGLAKPSFTPADWVFAPTWTLLYVLIAVAGWQIWRGDAGGRPMRLWWAQLLLNFMWSPLFFSAHQTGLALVVIILLLATILTFIALAWRQNRLAAWLFVPYAGWVTLASLLNAEIFRLN
jgi:tryptophan-rich sensory protein